MNQLSLGDSLNDNLRRLLRAEYRRKQARYQLTDRQLTQKYQMSFKEKIMDTLKQTVVTALSNWPDVTDLDDMIVVWRRLQFHREQAELPPSPPSCWEVAKEYISSLAGPADLSTNPT